MYKIFINHCSIDIVEKYEVESYFSINDLKNLILNKHNYSNMKLIFSGKILKDDFTLEYYDISEENMIICLGKMFMNNTPNISSIRENPPIRPSNPNNNINMNPSTNIPQLNRNNNNQNNNLRFPVNNNNNTSTNTTQPNQNNMGSITVNVPINPFLNITNMLSSITSNNSSLTNNNNFMHFFSSTLNNDPYVASLTSSINSNPFFNILSSQLNNQTNLSSITSSQPFMDMFSQIGSITNINPTSNNDINDINNNIHNFANSFINNLNRNNNPNHNHNNRNSNNNDLLSSVLNNPIFDSFMTHNQQNQNIDLNRPIDENDNQLYASEIEQLRNMGFYNNIHNINSLKYANGNIDEAVNLLISHV